MFKRITSNCIYSMKKHRINHLLFLLLLILQSVVGSAQEKYEQEEEVSVEEVPTSAVQFVDSLEFGNKIKWYREQGLDRISYEAKLKFKKQRISIEFSEEGVFEDLEMEIKLRSIPKSETKEIRRQLDSLFGKYSVQKIQIQYIGNAKTLKQLIHNEDKNLGLSTSYEWVVSTKEQGSFVLYELLFDGEGKLLRQDRIIQKMSDNLEY